jgi:hypothetical protein
MLDYNAEAETIRGLSGVQIAADAADEADGCSLLEDFQVSLGRTAVGYGGDDESFIIRGDEEGAAGDAIGTLDRRRLIDEDAFDENGIQEAHERLLSVDGLT